LAITTLLPTPEVNKILDSLESSPIRNKTSLIQLIKRPELNYEKLKPLDSERPSLPEAVRTICETETKYEGFIRRQHGEIQRSREMEKTIIPAQIEYKEINGLSREVVEKLDTVRPLSIGQASRISGITPAAISVLLIYLKNKRCSIGK
jgi:tRNA uridine 5-carboxymethylaminomethyl modification enzyme